MKGGGEEHKKSGGGRTFRKNCKRVGRQLWSGHPKIVLWDKGSFIFFLLLKEFPFGVLGKSS
jgi:hypothetical protein